jgi:hypothetical protein
VQVHPIKPTLKAPGIKLLELKYGRLLSKFAFKFNLRRYDSVSPGAPPLFSRMPAASSSSEASDDDDDILDSEQAWAAARQGLTLVVISSQHKRFRWDKGCIKRLFRGCSGGVRNYEVVIRVYFVSELAQVELKSGRV